MPHESVYVQVYLPEGLMLFQNQDCFAKEVQNLGEVSPGVESSSQLMTLESQIFPVINSNLQA